MAKTVYMIDNIEVHEDKNFVVVSVNPKIYPLKVVFAAAYAMLDKAYPIIDGDPQEEIIVELKPKTKTDLLKLGQEFNSELLNMAVYQQEVEENKITKNIIMQRAFLSHAEENDKKEWSKD